MEANEQLLDLPDMPQFAGPIMSKRPGRLFEEEEEEEEEEEDSSG